MQACIFIDFALTMLFIAGKWRGWQEDFYTKLWQYFKNWSSTLFIKVYTLSNGTCLNSSIKAFILYILWVIAEKNARDA